MPIYCPAAKTFVVGREFDTSAVDRYKDCLKQHFLLTGQYYDQKILQPNVASFFNFRGKKLLSSTILSPYVYKIPSPTFSPNLSPIGNIWYIKVQKVTPLSTPRNLQELRAKVQIAWSGLHWCAKIKDEVEKLAYQLNEEAERTERQIRRLSKVMYDSKCADMQVDVMGECLSSIKHVVGVRSVFLAKRLHAV
ncbi:uncharacterized protein TNCV_2154711 [Trichonephila clavipes]|nr:uncharacterized protein TNCV_2154711 [Trichonephila clavipes]